MVAATDEVHERQRPRGVGAGAFYKITPQEILVVHDELDLPPGTVKMKQGGGHGGHNGLKRYRRAFGYGRFLAPAHRHRPSRSTARSDRLRLHQPLRRDGRDRESMRRALKLWPQIVNGDSQAAMKKLHSLLKPTETQLRKK